MSCGCSNTTPITTTTNCGSCGYNCSNCTCPTNPIITPAVVCADPEPCSELFPLECVIYTGADIRCAGTADILYPNISHFLVLQNSNTTSRNFVSILNNINSQICYLFSKDYISQFLTNIQNDATLNTLFCNIVSACNCSCTLTCPVVTSVTYNLNSPGNDTVTGSFTRSTGGNTISFTGSISGNTLSIITGPSVGTIQVGQQIFGNGVLPNTFITGPFGSNWTVSVAYPQPISSVSMTATWIQYITSLYIYLNNQFYYSSSNSLTTNNTFTLNIPSLYDGRNDLPWLVSVQAVDKIAEMLNNPTCTKGTYFPNSSIAVTPNDCGFAQTRPVVNLTCPYTCIERCTSQGLPGSLCSNYWLTTTSGFLTFKFQQNILNPTTTFRIQKYIIHWYKRILGNTIPNSTYKMMNPSDYLEITVPQTPSYTPNLINTVSTNIPATGQPEQWLVLKTAVIDPAGNCKAGYQVRRDAVYYGYELDECDYFIYNV
jgi:hypothetical protein